MHHLSPDLGFLLNGRQYSNNSVITVNDNIGTEKVLYCLSPSNASTVNTKWYLPDGKALSSINSSLHISIQSSNAITLNGKDSVNAPNGILRCETLDASGTRQSIYIGIYNQTHGQLDYNNIIFVVTSMTI